MYGQVVTVRRFDNPALERQIENGAQMHGLIGSPEWCARRAKVGNKPGCFMQRRHG